MSLYHGRPYRAAVLLEASMADESVERDAKSLELLANSWLMARENSRAVEPLTKAAELSEKGDVYVAMWLDCPGS